MSGSDYMQFKGRKRLYEEERQIVSKDNPAPVTLQDETVGVSSSSTTEELFVAFSESAKAQQEDIIRQLDNIVEQLKIMNIHLSVISDIHIDKEDL